MAAPATSHEAALAYASQGWRVAPIKPNEKRPPMGGWQNAATDDLDTINAWYQTQYPGHGVCIATGQGTDCWVLDVDTSPDKDGPASLRALEAEYGELPATVTAVTGSGGLHYYFAWRSDREVRNLQRGDRILGSGLDVRGHHGQVVAPPTVHPNGTPYVWSAGRAPWEIGVAEAPDWLYELLDRRNPDPPSNVVPLAARQDDRDSIAEWINDQYDFATLLRNDGWHEGPVTADGQLWTRPGKDPRLGHSAVLHNNGDGPFVVFTTEAAELHQHGKPTKDGSASSVSLFGYVAATKFGGDRSELARQARRERNEQERPASRISLKADSTPADDDVLDWDEPIPLSGPKTEVLPFPTEVFPEWVRAAVTDVAASALVPIDMAACIALGALAAATTGRLGVKIAYGYVEPCNLFVVVGAEPTAGKTPAMKALLQGPLGKLESSMREDHEKKLETLRGSLKQAKQDKDEFEVIRLEKEIEAPAPLMTIGDVTPEALSELLNEQQRGISVVSDEGGPLLGLDRYRGSDAAAKLDPYLQGWSQGEMKQARVTRGMQYVDAKNANVSLVLTVQPTVLDAMYGLPELEDRGFIARMSIALPSSLVGSRDFMSSPDPDEKVRVRYDHELMKLGRDALAASEPRVLELDSDAALYFRRIRQTYEDARGQGLFNDSRGRINPMKAESMAVRFAGLLHHASGVDSPVIGVDGLKLGEAVASYFVSHEGAIRQRLSSMVDSAELAALKALKTLVGDGRLEAGVWVSQSDLRRMSRQFQPASRCSAVLRLLEDNQWVATGVEPFGKNRTRPVVMVRPDIGEMEL